MKSCKKCKNGRPTNIISKLYCKKHKKNVDDTDLCIDYKRRKK